MLLCSASQPLHSVCHCPSSSSHGSPTPELPISRSPSASQVNELWPYLNWPSTDCWMMTTWPPCGVDRRGPSPSVACQQPALCVCRQHSLLCDVLLCQVTSSTDAGWDQSAPAHVCVTEAAISPFVWTTVASALSSFLSLLPTPPCLQLPFLTIWSPAYTRSVLQ